MDTIVQLLLVLKYLFDEHPEYPTRGSIVHRNIKTRNVLVTGTLPTGGPRIRLGDFGIARYLSMTTGEPSEDFGNEGGPFANTAIGTPYYLPPEMCSRTVIMVFGI